MRIFISFVVWMFCSIEGSLSSEIEDISQQSLNRQVTTIDLLALDELLSQNKLTLNTMRELLLRLSFQTQLFKRQIKLNFFETDLFSASYEEWEKLNEKGAKEERIRYFKRSYATYEPYVTGDTTLEKIPGEDLPELVRYLANKAFIWEKVYTLLANKEIQHKGNLDEVLESKKVKNHYSTEDINRYKAEIQREYEKYQALSGEVFSLLKSQKKETGVLKCFMEENEFYSFKFQKILNIRESRSDHNKLIANIFLNKEDKKHLEGLTFDEAFSRSLEIIKYYYYSKALVFESFKKYLTAQSLGSSIEHLSITNITDEFLKYKKEIKWSDKKNPQYLGTYLYAREEYIFPKETLLEHSKYVVRGLIRDAQRYKKHNKTDFRQDQAKYLSFKNINLGNIDYWNNALKEYREVQSYLDQVSYEDWTQEQEVFYKALREEFESQKAKVKNSERSVDEIVKSLQGSGGKKSGKDKKKGSKKSRKQTTQAGLEPKKLDLQPSPSASKERFQTHLKMTERPGVVDNKQSEEEFKVITHKQKRKSSRQKRAAEGGLKEKTVQNMDAKFHNSLRASETRIPERRNRANREDKRAPALNTLNFPELPGSSPKGKAQISQKEPVKKAWGGPPTLLEEERQKLETEKKRLEAEKKKIEEEHQKIKAFEEVYKKLEEEKKRFEEERKKIEEENKKISEEKKKMAEEFEKLKDIKGKENKNLPSQELVLKEIEMIKKKIEDLEKKPQIPSLPEQEKKEIETIADYSLLDVVESLQYENTDLKAAATMHFNQAVYWHQKCLELTDGVGSAQNKTN